MHVRMKRAVESQQVETLGGPTTSRYSLRVPTHHPGAAYKEYIHPMGN
jgi:hypothetical protein